MEGEIIISSENVRPSSPTPANLRTYKFSMVDQVVPSMLVPFVLFFDGEHSITTSDQTTAAEVLLMKRSLSLILTRYYPLAGRLNGDGQSIDCNDRGVPFIVAKFRGLKLSHLLRNPDRSSLRRLLPCEIPRGAEHGPDSSVALIRVSHFDCGGIAVGAVFAHRVADAATIAAFLNSWAAATRRGGSTEPVCPNYLVQSMFPQKAELWEKSDSMEDILSRGKSVMRRYVFDASAISSLKSRSTAERPTRLEAVSALIWECFADATLAHNISASVVTHAVNLRRRARPPLSPDCFGNFLGMAAAASSSPHDDLVRKLRDALRKIDHDYVDRMRGDGGLSGHQEKIELIWSNLPEDANMLGFTSWCGLGLYGADFGWGKPIWIAKCDVAGDEDSPFANSVWLMDTRNGDGVEAWINLDEKYMSVFDGVEELRALASADPCPLDV